MKQFIANFILYSAINFSGMYTKYLTDRAQRLAFIETHKAMEHKKESEKEYQRTQKLLDSSKHIFIQITTLLRDCIIMPNVLEKPHMEMWKKMVWIENWYKTIIIFTLEYFIAKFRVMKAKNGRYNTYRSFCLQKFYLLC